MEILVGAFIMLIGFLIGVGVTIATSLVFTKYFYRAFTAKELAVDSKDKSEGGKFSPDEEALWARGYETKDINDHYDGEDY